MRQGVFGVFAVIMTAACALEPSAISKQSGRNGSVPQSSVIDRLARLPLRFEANHGQWQLDVAFVARGAGYGLFLTPGGATLALQRRRDAADLLAARRSPNAQNLAGAARKAGPEVETAVVSMHVLGGRAIQPEGRAELPGGSNYFVGNDPSKWRTNVQGYGRVVYRDVRPGVDVVYHGNGQRALEYDIVAGSGVDPETITLAFEGADHLTVDDSGALVLTVGTNELRQSPPVAYQTESDGTRTPVMAAYCLRPGGIGFVLGRHDRRRPIVIDPVLSYSTYLGGSDFDYANGIAVDASGSAYVTGFTYSTPFPTTPGAYQVSNAGTFDAFVTKLSPSGAALVYSTYLGGSGGDEGYGIAVDASGNAYIMGVTSSTAFPTTPGAFKVSNAGGFDAFVTKLSPSGAALVYSTYLGGSGDESGGGIAVDASGNAYITGTTSSTPFPTTPGAYQVSNAGGSDAFVTKLSPNGAALVYSTCLGGSLGDVGRGIAVDASGNAYVTGQTNSTPFPTTPGAYQVSNAGGSFDAFVTKLSANGAALIYSTYLGGNSFDVGAGIAVDAPGNAYVTGATSSPNFPTMAAYIGTHTGTDHDAFVTKLSASGAALVYSTYLGGSLGDDGSGIAVDASGNAYVTGTTTSTNFPIKDAYQPSFGGSDGDVFVTKLAASGTTLVYSTYLGSSSIDVGNGIAVDASGSAYVTGYTGSTTFPTTAGAYQGSNAGNYDAFVTKLPSPSSTIPAIGPAVAGMLFALLLVLGAFFLGRRRWT